MLKLKNVKPSKALENLLRVRAVRSLSGVAIVTVLTKPYPCPGKCLYCPSEKDMPKSYLKNEPAAARAYLMKFNPYKQVRLRLHALQENGHPTDKIELIVLGGTWSAYPNNYQYWFIKECFRACNQKDLKLKVRSEKLALSKIEGLKIESLRKLLKKEQRINETAGNRIIGLTLETRPDYVNLEEIIRMRDLGCTRIELGAQTIYDDVLKKNRRGHTVNQTIYATRLLKDAGFKINYHIMLNLPGSNLKHDAKILTTLFSNPDFQPDLLKIYPCSVLKTAPLYRLWQKGGYKPYTQKQLFNLLLKIKREIPPYVRVQRIIRDIPSDGIVAGSQITNLRQLIDNSGRKICCCIRCREVKAGTPAKNPKLFRQDYPASGGKEIFLSFEDTKRKKLYALLRLRIPSSASETLPVLKNAALIRELHTYGRLAPLNANTILDSNSDKKFTQHKGFGKRLMGKAEKIVKKETPLRRIAVISGIGVREYYKNLGYGLKDEYMIKNL